MAKTYGFGVVGAGMIGHFHAEAIKQLPNGKLVAVCDSVPEAAKALADKWGCAAVTQVDKLLERDDIDLITVGTPSGTHAEIAIAAAQAGKHCLAEKPLDVTLERIDEAIAAHEKAGTTLGGVFNSRFMQTARLFRAAVDEGRFGTLTFGLAYGPWWRDQEPDPGRSVRS